MRRRQSSLRGQLLACAASLAMASGFASAATAEPISPEQRADYQQAFQATLADPGNLDKALRYAILAGKVGDLEGAIGALERMLIFNPDLPRVRLELGVLYYRLGSFEVARSYLERAKESKDMPGDVRGQVERYLTEIENRTAHHRLTGLAMTGLRYQWNAAATPVDGMAKIFTSAVPVRLDQNNRRTDGNGFALATLAYVYDPQDGGGMTVEANLLSYGTAQIRASNLNLTLNRLDAGPRWKLSEILEGASVRPYALGSLVTLGGSRYYAGQGGGLQLALPLSQSWYLELEGTAEYKDYRPMTSRPMVNGKDGWDTDFKTTLRYALTPSMLVGVNSDIGRVFAAQPWEAYDQAGIGAEWSWRFASPLPGLDQPWTLGVSTSYVWKFYDKPDRTVDPGTTRSDRQWDIGNSLQIGVSEQLSLVMQAQYVKADSNLPNYRYSNKLGFGAVAYRF